MKSLTLFRHAKTERESATGRDFDRRLAERGREDAPRVGEELRKLDLDYDLILSSPAARAAETAEMAGLPVQYDERIYDATTDELLSIVRNADASVNRLMMVGHNPGFERLASQLVGYAVEMPTGCVVEIDLASDRWSEAGNTGARLMRQINPKELR